MAKVVVHSSKILYEGKWLTLRKDVITKPDGNQAIHEVISRKNGVILIAHKQSKLVFTRSYRYPVNQYSLEFPMGFIEEGEQPIEAARRECSEETGLILENCKVVGSFWAWSGLTNQTVFVVYGEIQREGNRVVQKGEEDLEWLELSQGELQQKIKTGEIKNSATLAAYSLWKE